METMKLIRDIEAMEREIKKNQKLRAKWAQRDAEFEEQMRRGDIVLFFLERAPILCYRIQARGQVFNFQRGWTRDEVRATLGAAPIQKSAAGMTHWSYVVGHQIVNFLFHQGLLVRIAES